MTFLSTKHRTHSDIMDLLTSKLGHTSTGANIPVASHVLLFSTEYIIKTHSETCRPILNHFMYETSALVNLITCSGVQCRVSRKTRQKLSDRLNRHRADIRNNADTRVGIDFGQTNHQLGVSGLDRTSKEGNTPKATSRALVDRVFLKSKRCLLYGERFWSCHSHLLITFL